MKSKQFLKSIFIFSLLSVFLFTSCQEEIIEITNPTEETVIQPDSNLATLMRNTATNDGSADNIIDYANCISVVLPVTVTVNGVTITIESVENYQTIEDLFDVSDVDVDSVEIHFPITIILSDYTAVVIENQDQLEVYVAACHDENEDDDDIECIDFQYPISISVYDTMYQVIETVTIANDEALYHFTMSLEDGVLASLNFPVTMILSNGDTVTVQNNQELEAVIEDAMDDCDEDDDNDWDDHCPQEYLEELLLECHWIASTDLFSNVVSDNFFFNEDGTLVIRSGVSGNVVSEGTWEFGTSASGDLSLSIQQIDVAPYDALNHEWIVDSCDEGYVSNPFIGLVFENHVLNLYMECEDSTTNDCFEEVSIEVCDEDGVVDGITETDLTAPFVNCATITTHTVLYYETYNEAIASVNPIAYPEAYTNTVAYEQTVYVVVANINDDSDREIYEIHIEVEDCVQGNDGCSASDVFVYLTTCEWVVASFEGSDELSNYHLSFQNNGVLVLTDQDNNTYTGHWGVDENSNGLVLVWFDNINAPDINVISGEWHLSECEEDRLELEGENTWMVLERDC